MNYVWAFVAGGLICVVGQLFIDYTKLSCPDFNRDVVAGVILSAVGLYSRWWTLPGLGPACRCWVLVICWPRAYRTPWTSAGFPARLPAD